VWQLHLATGNDAAHNVAERFSANMAAEKCQGKWIKITARQDGSFTVSNSRNNFEKTYSK
jgi:hypothetical protein